MAADERDAVSEALRLLAEADAGRGAPPRVEAAVLAAWRSRHARGVADMRPASVSEPVSVSLSESESGPLPVPVEAERLDSRMPAIRLGAMRQWAAALLAAVALSAAWELARAPEPSSTRPSGVSRGADGSRDGDMAGATPSRSRSRSASRADGPGANEAGTHGSGANRAGAHTARAARAGGTGDDDRRPALDAQRTRGATARASAAAIASSRQGNRDDSDRADNVSDPADALRASADPRTAGLDASHDRAGAQDATAPSVSASAAGSAPAVASAASVAAPAATSVARTPDREAAAPAPASNAAAETVAFTPLPYVEPLQPMEVPQVVRMAVPRDTAVQAGLFTRDRALPASGRVLADVLVGEDGVARGIRLVRQR